MRVTSGAYRVVWIVSDPLKLGSGREGVGDVPEVLELLQKTENIYHFLF